jgi:NAD(P)H-hydrate epimerase
MTQLNPLLEKATAIVVGPGIGLHKESFNAISILLDRLESLHKPTLMDADALKAFEPLQRKMSFPVVLTPHTGEFEILSGRDIPTELEKKVEEVKSRSKKSGAVILLKGKIDIISDGLRVKLNRTGNPGMTVGGTGDLLSGIVASLMAQGCRPFEAAVAGAFINGAAGDFAYIEKGFHIMATDLLDHIPYTMINPMSHRDVQLLEN